MSNSCIKNKKYVYCCIVPILIIISIGLVFYKRNIDEKSKICTNLNILVIGKPDKGIKFNYEKMDTNKLLDLVDKDKLDSDDYKYDLICIFNSEYEELKKEHNKALLRKIKIPMAFIGFTNVALPEMFNTYIGGSYDKNNKANIKMIVFKEGRRSRGYAWYSEFNYEHQKDLLDKVDECLSDNTVIYTNKINAN